MRVVIDRPLIRGGLPLFRIVSSWILRRGSRNFRNLKIFLPCEMLKTIRSPTSTAEFSSVQILQNRKLVRSSPNSDGDHRSKVLLTHQRSASCTRYRATLNIARVHISYPCHSIHSSDSPAHPPSPRWIAQALAGPHLPNGGGALFGVKFENRL